MDSVYSCRGRFCVHLADDGAIRTACGKKVTNRWVRRPGDEYFIKQSADAACLVCLRSFHSIKDPPR